MIKKQKIAIITDASAGMHKLDCIEKGIFFLPIYLYLDEQEFKSGVNINLVDFYDKMKSAKKFRTSQPSPGDLIDVFNAALKEHDFAIYMPISDGISGTGNTARVIAKNKFPGKIFVPKSTRVMSALSHEVLFAKNLVEKNSDIKSVLKILEKRENNNFGVLVPKTLTYLKKGGRITPLAAALGNIMNIIPIIKWENGILDKAGKTRTQKRAVLKGINLVLDYQKSRIKNPFYIIYHSNNLKEAKEVFDKLNENIDHGNIIINEISPCIGIHVGPGSVGLAVVEK